MSHDEDEDFEEEEDDEEAPFASIFTALRAAEPAAPALLEALTELEGSLLGEDYIPLGERMNALALACERGILPFVEMLLAAGASPCTFFTGSKLYNTYLPLFLASLTDAERAERKDVTHLLDPLPASHGGQQQRLAFGKAGGVGFVPPPPPPTPAADSARRKAIVRRLVAAGAGTELDVSKRPQVIDDINGWESHTPLPPFSTQQAALITSALASGAGAGGSA